MLDRSKRCQKTGNPKKDSGSLQFVGIRNAINMPKEVYHAMENIHGSSATPPNYADRLNAYLNNIINKIVQSGRDLAHQTVKDTIMSFFPTNFIDFSDNRIISKILRFLIGIESKRFHRRFEHFSVRRLLEILERSGHETNPYVLNQLIKYCDLC